MSAFVSIPAGNYPRDAFDAFNPALVDIDLGNARALMWFSQLAYETAVQPTLDHVKTLWTLRTLTPLVDTKAPPSGSFDTRLIVAEHDKGTIVAFAGTDPVVWQNLFTDFNIVKTPGRGTHAGFQGAFDNISQRLFDVIKTSKRPLIFAGHSLGAALAVLAAERAFDESQKPGGDAGLAPAMVYVYGMPRVGNLAWAQAYDAKLGAKTFRFVHASDIVARVPRLGFHHVGRVLDCGAAPKFALAPPAKSLSALGADDPSLTSGIIVSMTAWMARFGAGQLFGPEGPGSLGWTFRFLPPPIRDHLQDQYYGALEP
jgi:triacylglycerol lipase